MVEDISGIQRNCLGFFLCGKALGEEALGAIDPPLNQVSMRRQANEGPKKAQQMKPDEIRDIRELGEGDVLQKMGIQILKVRSALESHHVAVAGLRHHIHP